MRTIIASLSIFYFAFLKAFIVSDRNLTRREYAVYSAVSFVLVLMLWLVFVGTVSDIAKENGWALMPDFIEELYRRTSGSNSNNLAQVPQLSNTSFKRRGWEVARGYGDGRVQPQHADSRVLWI